MFPDPAERVDIDIAALLGNSCGLATVAPHNQRTNGTASFPGRVGFTVQPDSMADHDLVCSWRSGPLVVL